jgi:hypothetical protein
MVWVGDMRQGQTLRFEERLDRLSNMVIGALRRARSSWREPAAVAADETMSFTCYSTVQGRLLDYQVFTRLSKILGNEATA